MTDPTVVDRIVPGDHVCWTFADDDERSRVLAAYVRTGLAQGHKVLCHAQPLPREHVLRALAESGVPVTAPLDRGQLRVDGGGDAPPVDARCPLTAVLSGWCREIEAARAEGWSGLRVAGDMTWVRETIGAEHLLRQETQVNRLFTEGYAIGLCFYDRRRFTPAELNELASAHPGTAEPGPDPEWAPLLRIRRTADPPGLRLAGEADISNRGAVTAVIAGLFDDLDPGDAPVTIDVSELTFADGAAAHLLARAAETAPTELRIVGCSPALTKVLQAVSDRPPPIAPK